MYNKKVIAVLGPTASGKTNLAIALAIKFKTEIISADSRQFYKEMSIGTAKPTPQELAQVQHHFIGNLSVKDEYSSGQFEKDALEKLNHIHKTHNIVIVVGGSGLYLKALFNGFDQFPAILAEHKEKWRNASLVQLQDAIKNLDPEYANIVDLSNKQRLTRALEVIEESGQPFSTFLKSAAVSRPFEVIKVGLDWPREILFKRINQRVDQMLNAGLEAEVKTLLHLKHLNALNTVGYKEMFCYLNGEMSKEEAIRLIKRNSRRFAKRQLTWFRKDKTIRWIDPLSLQQFILEFSF